MAIRPSLPRVKASSRTGGARRSGASSGGTGRGGSRGSAKSSNSKRRRKSKIGIIGGLGAGLFSALGGLFGGGLAKGTAAQEDKNGTGGGSKGSGKANYGPLPSFTIQAKTVRKYNNPSLATVSLQMVMLLKEMGLVESALQAQFRQQQFAYTENARVQREINAESKGHGFVPFTSPDSDGAQLGALSVKQLSDSYLKFGKALDDATDVLNNMDCSCDGSDINIPFLPDGDGKGKPGKGRKTKDIKPFQRIAKNIALTKEGNVKPGYLAKKDSLGRTYYIKQGGMEGAIRRKSPTLGRFIYGRQSFDLTSSEIKRLTQKGYTQSGVWWRGPDGQPVNKNEIIQAAKNPIARAASSFADRVSSTVSRITKPLTEKITGSNAFQAAKRVSKAAVTKIKSFAGTIKGLAKWAQSAVDEAFEKLRNTKAAKVYEQLVKSKGFNRIVDTIRKNSGVLKVAAKLAALAFWIYMCWEYGVELYNVYKNRKKLSYKEISDQVSDILTRAFYDVGITGIAMLIGSMVGSAVAPVAGTLVGILVGAAVGFTADWLATATGTRGAVTDFIAPYIKQFVEWCTGQYAKRVNNEDANLGAPPPKPKPALSQSGSKGEGTVPFKKPAAGSKAGGKSTIDAALKAEPKETVGGLIDSTATRVGIDPALMSMIASENVAFDPRKQVANANGSEIFKLTPQQWSYITSQYGSKYPELYAGINDPKAATTAGALLIKDSQDFLTKNNIPASPLSLYGSYLFGNEGLRKLLNSSSSDVASSVLPEAALARPELFKDMSGDVSVGALVQKLYGKTLPEKQKRTTPEGTPVIPTRTQPKVEVAPIQQKSTSPPAAPMDGGGSATAAPATSTAAPAPSGGGASATAKEPSVSAVPPPETAKQMAEPVPPSPSTGSAAAVDTKTRELDKQAQDTQAGAGQPIVVQAPGGQRRPEILPPSENAGYTGTGNVPDPAYIFADIYEYQFRFRSSSVVPFWHSLQG